MNSHRPARPWIIRPCRPEDRAGVNTLFESVFGRAVPEGYWDWKLRPFPVDVDTEWVADAGGEIVGHYAATPIRFKLGDRIAIVPHGSDAMTRADYRRQGILTALGRRVNEVWDLAGSPFQIGYPLVEWGSVRESLGWRPVVHLAWLKHWIRPATFLRMRLGWSSVRIGASGGEAGTTGEVRVETVLRADCRFDRLWEKLWIIVRTSSVSVRCYMRCLQEGGHLKRTRNFRPWRR